MQLTSGVYGLEIECHGGSCCGITHLFNFPSIAASTAQRIEWLKTAIDDALHLNDAVCDYDDSNGEEGCPTDEFRHAVECVLIQSQIDQWGDALEAVGFKKVFDFLNHNSNNRCFVFYLETNRPESEK